MQFTIAEPWVFTVANAGTDNVDSDVVNLTSGRTAQFFLPAGAIDTSIDAGIYQVQVLPEPPVVDPETPTVTPPTVVEDTKVLGIQETLPLTGFGDWQAAMLALSMIFAGLGLLLLVRKEDLVIVTKGFGSRIG